MRGKVRVRGSHLALEHGQHLVDGLVLEVLEELALARLEEHLGDAERVISRREVGDRDEDLGELG